LMPRSMLESMPGSSNVSVWTLAEDFRWLHTWLIWRRGAGSANLAAMLELLDDSVLATSTVAGA
jgi:hypothetical protein